MARVLIVDDEESIRVTLGTFAERSGHRVTLAESVADALDHLRRAHVDVVISDIVLPRQSGIALLSEVRATQPDAQVVMITGEPEVSTAAEAVRKGAFDYLAKPVDRDQFEQVLAAAAAKKELLDRNRLLEEENKKHRDELERLVEIRTRELRLINETATTLALAEGVDDVYRTAYRSVCTHMDVDAFIVSLV